MSASQATSAAFKLPSSSLSYGERLDIIIGQLGDLFPEQSTVPVRSIVSGEIEMLPTLDAALRVLGRTHYLHASNPPCVDARTLAVADSYEAQLALRQNVVQAQIANWHPGAKEVPIVKLYAPGNSKPASITLATPDVAVAMILKGTHCLGSAFDRFLYELELEHRTMELNKLQEESTEAYEKYAPESRAIDSIGLTGLAQLASLTERISRVEATLAKLAGRSTAINLTINGLSVEEFLAQLTEDKDNKFSNVISYLAAKNG